MENLWVYIEAHTDETPQPCSDLQHGRHLLPPVSVGAPRQRVQHHGMSQIVLRSGPLI